MISGLRLRKSLILGLFLPAASLMLANCTRPAEGRLKPAPNTFVAKLDGELDRSIPKTAIVEKVASGFGFTEGPMWRDGRLWFSDLTGNKVLATTPDGKVDLLLDHGGGLPSITGFKGPNAMVTEPDGSVLLAQHGARRIVRLGKDMSGTPLITEYQGKKLNSPNDMVLGPDGALWFTDPPFGLDDQDKSPQKEQAFNGVYRYAGGTVTAMITDMARPNGIAFSPDGKTLYVSNSAPDMHVRQYDVGPNGALSNRRTFISYPGAPGDDVPDGLKVDQAGNVWSTGPGGIRIISPAGKVLGQIKLPEVAANLAWALGGESVYITASTSIYRIRLR
ncbi:MAG: SMP-30/gluconolactonase/LRE family protein [Caulobacteraceae bacterium]